MTTASARLTVLSYPGSVREVFDERDRVLTDGSVTFDRSGHVRRSVSLTVADPTGALVPQRVGDLFAAGSRIRVERGTDGRYLQVCEAIVTGFSADMRGVMTVSAQDPLWLLEQPLGEVVTLDDGMTAEDALARLWEPVLEPFVGAATGWHLDGGGRTVLAHSYGDEEDRGQVGVELMSALGLEVFADRYGIPVMRPIPDPTAADTVRTFVQRAGEATMTDLSRGSDRRRYNKVVAIRDAADQPTLRAEAQVDDPASPLHRDRIGLQVAPYLRSATVPDQAALNAVAVAHLRDLALDVDAVGGSAYPDHTLDEDDVVSFWEPVTGTNDRYRLDRVTHPVLRGGLGLEATKIVPLFLA